MPPKRGDTALVRSRGSGFEDGFADPPMTPAEAEVETLLYDPDRPFEQRIETAIQRFVARRRMTPERLNLFHKYLALGGVDTTQRQFTGTAKQVKGWKDEGLTKDEIRGFTANDFLGHGDDRKGKFYNPEFPEHWDVDFSGVVAGYLGTYLPEISGPASSEVFLAADTILNFLRYLQHHDVCPEHRDDLVKATQICELATTELPRVGATGSSMPGDFSLACRILFCCSPGSPAQPDFSPTVDKPALMLYDEKKDHELTAGEMTKVPGTIDAAVLVPADFNAMRVFLTTIALQEPEMAERVTHMKEEPIRVVNTYEDAFEVRDIAFAPEGFCDLYKAAAAHDSSLRDIGPVGYILLAPTIIENGWDGHPTLEEGRPEENPGEPIKLYLDHAVMDHLTVGMKLRLAICATDVGLNFIKECRDVLPSFHVFLPQTLMMDWKPPRLNDRTPPSADDPDREERQMYLEMEREEREMIKEQRKVDPELDMQMREVEDGRALEKAMEAARI